MKIVSAVAFVLAAGQGASAALFDLDSVAAWGKFPRFCVNTYRWGDSFFNGYDHDYVEGTGTKFNVKATSDSWIDNYQFIFPDNQRVSMTSDPSTSLGAYLTYLAVSVGYDVNVSNLFGYEKKARRRYRFGFDSALLSFEMYWQKNHVGTTMTKFGDYKDIEIPFDGIYVASWGADMYYFFNHTKYSQAAAFNFSKIQKRNAGSFYAGLSFYSQDYDFDFNKLPSYMADMLPEWWIDRHYRISTNNYAFRLGYGRNWVLGRKWLIGMSFSPTVGISSGNINSEIKKTDWSLFLRGRVSVVWNSGRWFAGMIGKFDSAVVSDRKTMFLGSELSLQLAMGYRFNIW